MKTRLLLIAALALIPFAAQATYCTNGAPHSTWPACKLPAPPKIEPKATPVAKTTVSQEQSNDVRQRQEMQQAQNQESVSRSGARSSAASRSQAEATSESSGGTVGDVAPVQTLGVGGDTVHSKSRALSLFLPPLAFTPPMAPIQGCAPEITQSAVGVGAGLFSKADSHTDPQDCTLITLYNQKLGTCQYASAKQIEDLMIRKKLPDYQPNTEVKFMDYNERDCAVLKHSMTTQRVEALPTNFLAEPPVPKAVVVPPKPAAKKVVRKRPAAVPVPPCIDGVMQCVRRPII